MTSGALDIFHGVPDHSTAAAIRRLAERVESEDGAPPLSDRALSRLTSGDVEHLVVAGDRGVRGYGQRDGADLELTGDVDAATAVLDSLRGPVAVWSHGERSRLAPLFTQRGLARTRQLLQLRRGTDPLPADPSLPDGVTVRSFVAGRDEDAWVAVNAVAFATHPEQGLVTGVDVLALETEDWFDPAGFLLAERDGELVGYHWTKRHPDGGGEVYVLGIAPAAQGSGLGGALLVRGLRYLLDGGADYLLLYVEADNDAAVHLYVKQGFSTHDLDVQWTSS